jgi:hypothetical protein
LTTEKRERETGADDARASSRAKLCRQPGGDLGWPRMATAKLGRAVRVRFLLRAVLLVTTALTAAALAAGPANHAVNLGALFTW